MVLARVGAFVMEQIPEVVSVEVADESMLLEENNIDESTGVLLSVLNIRMCSALNLQTSS